MNKQNEAQLKMYDALIAYCNNNSDTVASVAAFQNAFTNFETVVGDIHNTVQMENTVITGITDDKNQLKTTLCEQAADLCAISFAFATNTGNNQLKKQVSFSVWELKRLTDEMLLPTCTNIYNALNDNIKGLKSFGITADSLSNLQTAMDDYQAVLASPRNAITQRSAHSAALSNLFKQANGILKDQLDKLIVQFKSSEQAFFIAYKRNRVMVSAGVGKAAAN